MANYPSNDPSNASLMIQVNNVSTTLNGGLTAGATSATLTSSNSFPAAGFITVETEAIEYTGNNTASSVLSGLTRGADGTTANSHADGTAVYHNVVAAHHNRTKDEVIAIGSDLRDGFFSGTSSFASTSTLISERVSYKNRYANGEFKFDQRREAVTAYTVNASSIRCLDLTLGEAPPASGSFTVQKTTSTVPTGFGQALLVTVATPDTSLASTDDYDLRMPIEGNDVRDFLMGNSNAKVFTVSFWVRSSITGTFGFGIVNSAFNRSYVAQYSISAADTWEFKSVPIQGDTTGTWLTTTGVGIRIEFDMGSGSDVEATAGTWHPSHKIRGSGNSALISNTGATWHITGVQVERGPAATGFEYLPEAAALSRIQRYIEKSYVIGTEQGATTSTGQVSVVAADLGTTTCTTSEISFKTKKRSTPTVSLWDNSGTSSQWLWYATDGAATSRASTATDISVNGFTVTQVVATGFYTRGHFLATAEL